MKKKLTLLTATAFLLASSLSYGEAYIGASAGQTYYGSGFDRGTSFGVRAGYKFTDYLAIEGGYTDYGNTEWDYLPDVSMGANGLNLSAVALWPITEKFDIYAKAGVDYLQVSGDTGLGFSVSVDGTEFAYAAGVNIGFTDTIGMFVEYGGNTDNVSAGLKISFGGSTEKPKSRGILPGNKPQRLTPTPSKVNTRSTATYSASSQLRAVSESDKNNCQFIKSITRGAGGTGDVSVYVERAMDAALTEAANNGADSYSVVNVDTTDSGSSVVLEAFRCK